VQRPRERRRGEERRLDARVSRPGGHPAGSVYEWVDNCQVSAAAASQQSCLTRGGYYQNDNVSEAGVFDFLTCAVGMIENTKPREAFDDHIGIRCCSR
jgi:hypothetical protein